MKPLKLNRYERKENQKLKRDDALHGSGVYVYKNNTKGDLSLPKPTASGKRQLVEGEEFQGDDYYMQLVPSLLRYVRCIVPANHNLQENVAMPEQKLILDQPDRVTFQGTVEQVIPEKKQKLNESKPSKQAQDQNPMLITEDPLNGVEIILN